MISGFPTRPLYPAPSRRFQGRDGMTLLEMTVVILVLMTMISVLFFGAQAWKRGSDRAICIINIQNVQKGVRSFANLHGLKEGDTVANLQSNLIGLGRLIELTPACPGNGSYTFGSDVIPPAGHLYMTCTLAGPQQHEPSSYLEW